MDKVEEPDEMPCKEIWDLIKCGGYNTEVDIDIIAVMECIKVNRPIFYTDISIKLGFKKEYVELIQYIICSLDYAEYGTSPRGCWLTDEGEKILEVFKRRTNG